MARSARWLPILATLAAACGGNGDAADAVVPPPDGEGDAPRQPIMFHCGFAGCPAIAIAGDPVAPSGFRGYGDPSLERDPGGMLWLGYSWLDEQTLGTDPTPLHAVRTHLAASADGGASFSFVRAINTVAPAPGNVALVIHEVSTLARRADGSWHAAWLTYGLTAAARGEFHYQRTVAATPAGLGDAIIAWLRGSATTVATAIDESAIAGAEDCLVFTEPALFTADGTNYLATTCIVDPGAPATQRLLLLRESGAGLALVGELLTGADAADLDATRVEQIDLAVARDGAVLAIVTPIDDGAVVPHRGCVVLEVADLATATMRRDEANRLVRRAVITADGDSIGPGLCTYDADSATGVIITLTRAGTGGAVEFSLHATGVHP